MTSNKLRPDYEALPNPAPCPFGVGDTVRLASDERAALKWTIIRTYPPTNQLERWRLSIVAAQPDGKMLQLGVQPECVALVEAGA